MKTMLRATCAILVTVSMVTSAFAETSISDTSSLASISVNIGSKTYSGDEARKYLFSRVQTQENTRITTDAKVQFLQGFNIKLSKVAGSYETRGGKASEIAKLLRAIGEDIQSEIMKLSGVSVNSAIIQTTSTTTESELAYYKGNAYKKDGFINTLNVNIE